MNVPAYENDYAILFVDDEEKTRKAFHRIFSDKYKIYLAENGKEGLETFLKNRDEIGIVMTDQRMPGETGVDLLTKVARAQEDVVRILSTAFAELDAAADAVNLGGIYRYVTKPWDIPELEITLRRAMELFALRKEQKQKESFSGEEWRAFRHVNELVNLGIFTYVASGISRARLLAATTIFAPMWTDGWRGLDSLKVRLLDQKIATFLARYDEGEETNLPLTLNMKDESLRTTPPSHVMTAAAVGCEGIQLNFRAKESPIWPTPTALLVDVMRPLIVEFSNLAIQSKAGPCTMSDSLHGVDCLFHSNPFQGGYGKDLLSSICNTLDSPTHGKLYLAWLRFYQMGGKALPIAVDNAIGYRLSFPNQEKTISPMEEASEFWGAYRKAQLP